MSRPIVIERVLWDGGSHGGCVFSGRTPDGESVRFVADRSTMPRPGAPGETYEVAGAWCRHPVHGRQVEVRSAVFSRPSGRLLMDSIAVGGEFPGIGQATAARLWGEFGEELYRVLDEGPDGPDWDRLCTVPRVGVGGALTLAAGFRRLAIEPAAARWLDAHGFPPALSRKVMAVYGAAPIPDGAEVSPGMPTAVHHLVANPYRMLAFAGWREVDGAARRMGLADDDSRRLVAAVEAAAHRQYSLGHTLCSEALLARNAAALLACDAPTVRRAIREAVAVHAIKPAGSGWQPLGAHVMESYAAERCLALAAGRGGAQEWLFDRSARLDGSRFDAVLGAFEAEHGYPLNPEQREAVLMAVTTGFGLVTGGAGVGKTTMLKTVHCLAAELGMTVHQMALAGRAARRMAEATQVKAYTIHGFMRTVQDGLRLDDHPLVVVDEASMLDLPTLYRLLRLCEGCRFLLVGDPHQLPPIGPGMPFHALAESGAVPLVYLHRVTRQSEASGIPVVSQAIRDGVVPDLPAFHGVAQAGVSILKVDDPARLSAAVVEAVTALGGLGAAQVITSVKRGPGGTHDVNSRLHHLFAPGRKQHGVWWEGEPVMATSNDWRRLVFNGTIGHVAGATEAELLVAIQEADGERVVPIGMAEAQTTLDLGFAATCHKAQGSQFRRILVALPKSRILDRAMLYTSVTRATDQVVVVGSPDVFRAAVEEPPRHTMRRTGFAAHLRAREQELTVFG